MRIAAICASGLLLAGYFHGYYALGFIALVPWLVVLERAASWRTALCDSTLMSVAYTMAAFTWLSTAIAAYTGISSALALLLMSLFAPLCQPQFWLFALARMLTREHALWLGVLVACAVWVVSEWLLPKALGDTLGYGLAPARWWRQAADLAGSAGLTAALLASNSCFAIAWNRRILGWRAVLTPGLIALMLPTALAGYGVARVHMLENYFALPTPSIRIGMVQSSLVDYEKRRQKLGSYAVVREVLDRHYALSQAAIEHHGAEALLWSETVYPTPFGYPRTQDGAAFDFELKSFVEGLGVPLLFGSYEVDERGEYNAAVLLDPERAITARYRKTRLFPFTERIPSTLDYDWVRRMLPWSGNWLAGNGARVFPLSTSDGRELNVVPLICLDDVDPMLAIEGARLGAQAIVGLSNDSWFSQYPQGMQLHLAVARFRSVETRLPQLRVTTNGYTAFIDPTGEVLAQTGIGEQAVLAGMVPIRTPPMSLVTRFGTWLGPVALASLVLVAWQMLHARFKRRRSSSEAAEVDSDPNTEMHSSLLSYPVRLLAMALKTIAALVLIYLALAMALREAWNVHSARQLWTYLALVLVPLVSASAIYRWNYVRVKIIAGDSQHAAGFIDLTRGRQTQRYALGEVASLRAWRWPDASVELAFKSPSNAHLFLSLQQASSLQLLQRISHAMGAQSDTAPIKATVKRLRARSRFFDHAGVKFGLFPLLMALPAFRLHQVISFGSTFGEYLSFGALAYLQGIIIWWASWSLGLMLWAAFLRLCTETLLGLIGVLRPALAQDWRGQFELVARLLFYLLVPIWFAVRVLAG